MATSSGSRAGNVLFSVFCCELAVGCTIRSKVRLPGGEEGVGVREIKCIFLGILIPHGSVIMDNKLCIALVVE
jgi:hypothetical protein